MCYPQMLDKVKHVILVMSGKGGVGKSTVSAQLALTLKDMGFKVGLLDVDLCGPSIPFMTGLEDKDVYQADSGWMPIYQDAEKQFGVMSIGFLLKSRNDAVIWRGPKKTAMIRQFINDVQWDDLDYLIVDTPPGTSDEHITIMESMKNIPCDGAIMVTTPQNVALADVRKQVTFCRKTGIKVLGVIENMSGFVCPQCMDCSQIFWSRPGGSALAKYANVQLLGSLPIDPRISALSQDGKSALIGLPESTAAGVFKHIVTILTK